MNPHPLGTRSFFSNIQLGLTSCLVQGLKSSVEGSRAQAPAGCGLSLINQADKFADTVMQCCLCLSYDTAHQKFSSGLVVYRALQTHMI